MSKNVRYEKAMRERAKVEKKWLVTLEVNGRHLKDDSVCIQRSVNLAKAKELSQLALELLNDRSAR